MAIVRPLLPCLLLAAVLPLAAAERVELRLRDGSVIRGTVVSQDDTQVVVESTVATRKGAMTASRAYPRRDIASMAELPDPLIEYRRRAPAATDATGHVALARWCRDNSLAEQYRAEAMLAIGLAPQDADALALMADLGLVLADGRWRPEAEVLAAQGKVRWKGEIMTTAEAAERRAAEERQQDAERAISSGDAGLAAIDRRLATIDRRRGEIEPEIKAASDAAAASRHLTQRAAECKATYEAAEQEMKEQQAAAKAKGLIVVNDALKRRIEESLKAWNAAKRQAIGCDRTAAQHDARAASLTSELQRLTAQREDLVAKRAAAAKALDEAKAAQAQAGTPAAPATP